MKIYRSKLYAYGSIIFGLMAHAFYPGPFSWAMFSCACTMVLIAIMEYISEEN